MVSSAEHGIRVRSYHLPCHKKGVLGDAKTCQIVRSRKRKSPQLRGLQGCFMPLAAGLCRTRDHSHSMVAGGLLDTS